MSSPQLKGLCPLIQVFDMATSLAFYRDLLGFQIVQQSAGGDSCGWAWLKRNEAELMLNTMFEAEGRPAAAPPARMAWHSDTGLFIGAPDVDAMYAYLGAKGVRVDPPAVRNYGMKQIYLKDPDGYGICFQWSAA